MIGGAAERRASQRGGVSWGPRGARMQRREAVMKPLRQFGPLPNVRYRPEITRCPHCGSRLARSHSVWAKPIQFLTGVEHVTSLGFRCPNRGCAFQRTVFRSARAEARQVKGSGYGLDVVAHIGALRFGQHRTREEIWRHLCEQTPV